MNFYLNSMIPADMYTAIVAAQSLSFRYDNTVMRNSELSILMSINRYNGITSSEIAHRQGCTKSYVSQVVSRLEKNGYIYRKQLSDRKRFYGLYPTDNGKKMANAFAEYVSATNKEVLYQMESLFTEEEIATFVAVGSKLGELMHEHIQKSNVCKETD